MDLKMWFINIGLFTISLLLTVTCIEHNCTSINSTQTLLIEKCFVHEEIISPHNFSYIHNGAEVACKRNKGEDIFLLVVVHTSTKNYKRRVTIRETWANRKLFPKVRVLFMLGYSTSTTLIDLIKYESDLYGDIVQQDFIDAYKNLTYKAIMVMKTMSEYCSNVKNLLKTDDDVVVNMYKYLRDINGFKYNNLTFYCLLFYGTRPIRQQGNKWYVDINEFPADEYGEYCSGPAYILSPDLPAKLYNLSLYTKFYWVDDYYLTGLLSHILNASYVNWFDKYMIYFDRNQTVKEDIYFVGVEAGLSYATKTIDLFYDVWINITCFETNKCKNNSKNSKLDRNSNIYKKLHFNTILAISGFIWVVVILMFYYFCVRFAIYNPSIRFKWRTNYRY